MSKIFIVTGGTGGHIIPALCLAQELAKNHEIRLLGDKNCQNYCKNEDFTQILSAKAPKTKFGIIPGAFKIGLGTLKSLFLMLWHRPKYVIGFGGYATFPTLIAAIITKRTIILHEQNAHLGKVNRIFAKFADKIALTFAKTSAITDEIAPKCVITGNPIRPEIAKLHEIDYKLPDFDKKPPKRDKMGYNDIILASEFDDFQKFEEEREFFNILILGGSGGAQIFSEIMPKAIFNLSDELKNNITITQQCRESSLNSTFIQYEQFNLSIEIESFFHDIDEKINAAHLIIARSGSSSLAEFSAAKKPMILIPYPFAADNHQEKNAQIAADNDCAILIKESELNINKFTQILTNLLQNPQKLQKMSKNCQKITKIDATKQLAKLFS